MEQTDRRTTYVKRRGRWIDCRFRRLKAGQIFRMYESTGEFVVEGLVTTDASIVDVENDVYGINCLITKEPNMSIWRCLRFRIGYLRWVVRNGFPRT